MQKEEILNTTAQNLWGKLVIYLREQKHTILHVICGDITDVEKTDEEFIIKTTQEGTKYILEEEFNKNILTKAFTHFGVNKYIIKLNEKSRSIEDDLDKLRKYFDTINIK